jgi:hypothetical protein
MILYIMIFVISSYITKIVIRAYKKILYMSDINEILYFNMFMYFKKCSRSMTNLS